MKVNENSQPVIVTTLESFIRDTCQVKDDDVAFDHDVDLFEAGYLDSLSGVRLVAFIEERLGLRLLDDDVLDERFGSINGISAVVLARLAAAEAPEGHGNGPVR